MPGSVTILQVSDLHRDPRNPIRNDALLTSLESDRDRYTKGDPRIPSPDILIVSGDVVQGAAPGTDHYEAVLAEQHGEALDFLGALTDRFLEGRRDRVVIVPGNHDVSACHATESFRRVDVEQGRNTDLVGELFRPESPVRWSWKDFSLFEIGDKQRYAERMAPFAAFYRAFYQGAREFDLDPAKQFAIFDFPQFDLTVAGLSSCHTNDIFNKQGAVHPACIASVGEALRQPRYNGRLRIAVWHHNTEGLPMQTDYMDPGVLQNLIDCGFGIGFHGHQHRPQFLDTRFRYGGKSKITVISAGTLCGSASYRHGRAYNLVELNVAARSGRLHVREMLNDNAQNLQLPIWGRRVLEHEASPYSKFTFDPPPEPLVPTHAATATLVQAQQLMDKGEPEEAASLLGPLASQDELARRLLLECLLTLHETLRVVKVFDPPTSEVEALALMDALWSEKEHERLRALLADPLVAESVDGAVIELRTKYRARLTRDE